jgi:hypothetical protein
MLTRAFTLITAAGLGVLATASAPRADEFEAPLRAFAESELRAWIADPGLISALRAQNAVHGTLSTADIGALDDKWKAEVGAASAPMIEKVLARPESVQLRERQDAAAGVVTEVFVMDNRGLNVAQSGVTSDYWQGDEAKWQDSYGAGPGGFHISEVEYDESTQTYQSQVSIAIVDPATGEAIGAATFGVDVSLLQ